MKHVGFFALLISAACGSAAAQVWDNSGNNKLSGTYYFREVFFTSTNAVAVYGNINFSGDGSYTITATQGISCTSTNCSAGAYSSSGTYSIAASGFGFISNQLVGSPVYGLVGANGVFVGSATESGYNDIFIAAPVSGQSLGTLQGSYSMGYLQPSSQVPYDALLQMSPNGSGSIGTVNVTAYATSSTPTKQSISGVKYIVSNNAFVVTFPTSTSNLISGQEYLYSTPDGSFVFGGSPQDFDMIVGIRTGSDGPFGGLYYEAGFNVDNSQLASGGSSYFETHYGAFTANNGVVVGHQRQQFGSTVAGQDFTYQDAYPAGTTGSYNLSVPATQFLGALGGAVRIGVGIGPTIGVSVSLRAPSVSGSGVFINPMGVVNAASSAPFTAGIARGELLTLVGNNLGPASLQVASSLPLPTTLGNVQVLIDGRSAPIYYVSSGQVSALVPYSTTGTVAQIQVVNNGVASNTVTAFLNQTSPGVFTIPAGGIGYAAALHPNGSLVTPTNPAQPGETVAVFLTGLGDVNPGISDGVAASSTTLSNVTSQVAAYVGGVSASVYFAGLAPGLAALYQMNITIPSTVTAGDHYLDIAGPDAYASEAIISTGGTSGNSAEPLRVKPPRGVGRIPFAFRKPTLE